MVSAVTPFARLLPAGLEKMPAVPTQGAAVPDFGVSLAEALGMGVDKAINNMRVAEKTSLAALQGADIAPREVVDAVMSAEQALQTTIAIRDKIVSAYLEISRMAI